MARKVDHCNWVVIIPVFSLKIVHVLFSNSVYKTCITITAFIVCIIQHPSATIAFEWPDCVDAVCPWTTVGIITFIDIWKSIMKISQYLPGKCERNTTTGRTTQQLSFEYQWILMIPSMDSNARPPCTAKRTGIIWVTRISFYKINKILRAPWFVIAIYHNVMKTENFPSFYYWAILKKIAL